MSINDKKWAKKANDLQFEQLEVIRSTASNWRTGLIALTALLTAVTIIKGPETAQDLSIWGRVVVAVLLGLALLGLLIGSALAMLAAYGFPGKEELITGDSLRKWVDDQSGKARSYLFWAAGCFFVSVLLIGLALAGTWFDKDIFPKDPPAMMLIDVERPADPANPTGPTTTKTLCGELKESDSSKLVIETETETAAGKKTEDALFSEIRAVALADECP